MAIKTRFDIKVDIDGRLYALKVSEPDRKQREAIDALRESRNLLQRERERIVADIQYAANEHDANAVIMSGEKMPGKIKIAREQKALVSQIREGTKALQEKDDEIAAVKKQDGDVYRRQFDAMVDDGEAKTMLEKLMETTSLTYATLVIEIRKLIAETREKN